MFTHDSRLAATAAPGAGSLWYSGTAAGPARADRGRVDWPGRDRGAADRGRQVAELSTALAGAFGAGAGRLAAHRADARSAREAGRRRDRRGQIELDLERSRGARDAGKHSRRRNSADLR